MLDLAERVADVPYWWHSIDLGDGVVTPGFKAPDLLEREWAQLHSQTWKARACWTSARGMVGSPFKPSEQGQRVVALDHFIWQTRSVAATVRPADAALDSRVEAVEADFMTMDLSSLGTFDVVFFLGVIYHLRIRSVRSGGFGRSLQARLSSSPRQRLSEALKTSQRASSLRPTSAPGTPRTGGLPLLQRFSACAGRQASAC